MGCFRVFCTSFLPDHVALNYLTTFGSLSQVAAMSELPSLGSVLHAKGHSGGKNRESFSRRF